MRQVEIVEAQVGAAALEWEGQMGIRSSHPLSYQAVCQMTGRANFILYANWARRRVS